MLRTTSTSMHPNVLSCPRFFIPFAQLSGASGDAINVCISGVSRVVAGGTITAGTDFFVMPGTAGKVYAYDGSAGSTQIIAGRFLPNTANTAASANEEIEILVNVSLGV